MNHQQNTFHSILIYGMGMMGASISLALRGIHFNGRIDGVVRSTHSSEFIKKHRLADRVFAGNEKVPFDEYDLIIFCSPIEQIVNILKTFPSIKGMITDISSTRRKVHAAFASRKDLSFVGSHPMCGTEDSGPFAAKPDLYYGRLCIITGSSEMPSDEKKHALELEKIEAFWQYIGMKTFRMDPKTHDEVLAYLSHAPHFLAGLIAHWAERSNAVQHSTERSPMPITGGGFRDMVRIAGANPEMWCDILESNKDNIIQSLHDLKDDLEVLISGMQTRDRQFWMDWLSSSRRARNRLSGYPEDK